MNYCFTIILLVIVCPESASLTLSRYRPGLITAELIVVEQAVCFASWETNLPNRSYISINRISFGNPSMVS